MIAKAVRFNSPRWPSDERLALVGLEAGILVGGAGGLLVAGPHLVGRMLGGLGGAVAGAMIGLIYGEEIGSHQQRMIWIEAPWPGASSTPSAPR